MPREYKDKKWQPKIRNGVALAMHGCRGNREDFIRLLNRQGIDVVFRENNEAALRCYFHRPQEQGGV